MYSAAQTTSKKQRNGKKNFQLIFLLSFFLSLLFGLSTYLLQQLQSPWFVLCLLGIVVTWIHTYFVWQQQVKFQHQRQQFLAQQQQNHLILQAIDSGLFLLNRDLKLSQQYSKQLESILNNDDLKDKNIIDILKPMVFANEIKLIELFFKQLFNDKLPDHLINELNPLSQLDVLIEHQGQASERSLCFQFTRIYQNQQIDHILVNIIDSTHALAQKKQTLRSDLHNQSLLNVIQQETALIGQFIEQTQLQLQQMEDNLNLEEGQSEQYKALLPPLTQTVNQLMQATGNINVPLFTHILNDVKNTLLHLKQQSYLQKTDFQPLQTATEQLYLFVNTLKQIHARLDVTDQTASESKSAKLIDLFDEEEDNIVAQWSNQLSQLAQQQEKDIRLVAEHVSFQHLPLKISYKLQDFTWYLIQLSAHYGIESSFERDLKDKNIQACIEVDLIDLPEYYQLVIQDDGQGMDLGLIATKAIDLGWLEENHVHIDTKQLLQFLLTAEFADFFSQVNERGLSLHQIHEWLTEQGGSIDICTQAQQYTRFTLTMPK